MEANGTPPQEPSPTFTSFSRPVTQLHGRLPEPWRKSSFLSPPAEAGHYGAERVPDRSARQTQTHQYSHAVRSRGEPDSDRSRSHQPLPRHCELPQQQGVLVQCCGGWASLQPNLALRAVRPRSKPPPGGAEFKPELIHNRSGAGSTILAVDLNKDGAMDIVTSTNRGTFIFWGKQKHPAPRKK